MPATGVGGRASATGVDTLPPVPSPLLTVDVVGRPSEGAERVVTLDAEGRQDAAGGGVDSADPADLVDLVDPELIETLGADGTAGQLHVLPDGRLLLGIGDRATDPAGLRRAGAALAGRLRARADEAADATSDPNGAGRPVAVPAAGLSESSRAVLSTEPITELVTGLVLGSHRFRVSTRRPSAPGRVELVVPGAELAVARERAEVAGALAAATALARDLASTPSDVKTPTWLVETAAEVAATVPGLTSRTWPSERLAAEGFGGLLAVGGGSSRPPALLRLDWNPSERADERHLVLVGKGITFDTGGISIKPADGMHLMRTDMAGGAAVVGALVAIARLRVPLRVTGLVPAAENHVSGSAYRPGDVVRHYDGTTTEVTNTDAEGRLVLADALGYAVRELAPDLIVDVATLTGAMKVTLGLRTGGLFATDDELADALVKAGERAGERLWRMPLLDHVAEEVASDIADVRQIPKGPSGIGAALFLREFTGGLPWAHLDIAGPARCEKPYDEVAAGATGFAARTLAALALGLALPGR
ncbi:leucyl aminopeptidase family protein [Pseudonocardia acaciae]|uniref:leucyl aminopeptidase family protein n=1 Tax=Pseudonocardia acaciae TaxID=551276 RepID=UPI000688B0BC|nr:M17 family metallopeptidase [Pseudonocardia acaciae]